MYAARFKFLLRSKPAALLDSVNQTVTEVKQKELVMFVELHPQTEVFENTFDPGKNIKYYFLKVVYNDQIGYIACDTKGGKVINPRIWLSEVNVDEIEG
jgi:hypothetical protein